jgi:hypothetical protein
VARHVDEADGRVVVQAQIGKADVDGDAAFLFLLQPVGVDAGQGLDQRRLAVIDVPGGPDDDVRHRPLFCRRRRRLRVPASTLPLSLTALGRLRRSRSQEHGRTGEDA